LHIPHNFLSIHEQKKKKEKKRKEKERKKRKKKKVFNPLFNLVWFLEY